jgi:peptidoglycan/xylan/chitin deacetylase (PgdA/CDA1 family)
VKERIRAVVGRLRRGLARVLLTPVITACLPWRHRDAVALTFDDGPHPQFTEEILAALAERGVKATFFLTGSACDDHPDLVRRIDAAGHVVANHGYSHYSPEEVSGAEYVADVEHGQEALERALGRTVPKVFRPPYGRFRLLPFLRLWRRGYRFVGWNLDSRDTHVIDPEHVVADVLGAVRGRDVILLHEDYEQTAAAVPALIDGIRAQGLRVQLLLQQGPHPAVALVSEYMPPAAGMTVQAETLLRRLRADGIDIFRVSTNPVCGGALAWIQRVRYLRGVIGWVRYLINLTSVRKADLVHLFSASGLTFLLFSVPTVVAARLLRRPLVMHYHGGGAAEFFGRWGRAALPFVRAADSVVVPSRFLREVFAAHGVHAAAIPNPIEVEPIVPAPDQLVVLSCRNLTPVYDIATAIRAFERLSAERPDARMLIAGEGPDRQALERQVAAAGLSGRIDFLGNVPHAEMAMVRARASILVNSSRTDNQPVSILEAMAAGLAVVSTDAGGIPAMLSHGEDALLSPVGDARRLGENLSRVASDVVLRRRLTLAARARVLDFRWEAVGPEWWTLYGELMPGLETSADDAPRRARRAS